MAALSWKYGNPWVDWLLVHMLFMSWDREPRPRGPTHNNDDRGQLTAEEPFFLGGTTARMPPEIIPHLQVQPPARCVLDILNYSKKLVPVLQRNMQAGAPFNITRHSRKYFYYDTESITWASRGSNPLSPSVSLFLADGRNLGFRSMRYRGMDTDPVLM
jgi:hypothetical protein